MEAINKTRVLKCAFLAFLFAALSVFCAGNLTAQKTHQNTPRLSGQTVAISKEYPTRSHIALLLTRNANNWKYTRIYRTSKAGKLVQLSNKDNKSLHVGDLVVVPQRLVRTHADTLHTESISAMCQQKYTNSDCAQRIVKINSLHPADTAAVHSEQIVYVPNNFAAKPTVSPFVFPPLTPKPNAPQHKSWLAAHPNWVLASIISVLAILIFGLAVLYYIARKRTTHLQAFTMELERGMRKAPRSQQIEMDWTIKPLSWSIRGSPPEGTTPKAFGIYKRALGTWVLTGPLRHLELSDSYDSIPQSELQNITIRARWLKNWDPVVMSLSSRQSIVDEMNDFANAFEKAFAVRISNAALGGPGSIEFVHEFRPEKGELEIKVRPKTGRSYPNYNQQSMIDHDADTVLTALGNQAFEYTGCTPDGKWVVLNFVYITPIDASQEIPDATSTGGTEQ